MSEPKFNVDESIMTWKGKKYTLDISSIDCVDCNIFGECIYRIEVMKCYKGIYKLIKNPSLKTQRMWPIDKTVKIGDKVWSLIYGNGIISSLYNPLNSCIGLSTEKVYGSELKKCTFKGHLKPGYKPILMIND